MRAVLKCLVLSALILAAANCSSTIGAKKTQSSLPSPVAPTTSYPKIVLYTVSWCHHCNELKKYLTDRKVPFTNLDVEKDESAMTVFAERYQATAVPLIVIGNDEAVLKGFDRDTLEKALREMKQ